MVFHATSTRVLFLGFTAFVGISTYVLIITHHLKLPQVDFSGHPRDKVAVEALHHLLLQDFAKYDVDRDSKLSVHEFAAMLHDSHNSQKEQEKQKQQLQLSSSSGTTGTTTDDSIAAAIAQRTEQQLEQKQLGQEGAATAGTLLGGAGAGTRSAGNASSNRFANVGSTKQHNAMDDEEYDDIEEAYGTGGGGGKKGGGAAAGQYEEDGDYIAETREEKELVTATAAAGKDGGQQQQGQQAAAATASPSISPSVSSPSPQEAATAASGGSSPSNSSSPSPSSPSKGEGAAAGGTAVAAAAGGGGGGGCPDLSREHVAQFARNNTVMLTVADWRIFGTMGINWMKHLAKWGVDYYLVGATDAKTAQFLGHTGKHPCFKFYEDGPQHGSDEYRYGDSHYNAATWRKVVVVSRMVHWGFNVIHSDVDVVWFRDPLPYFLGPALQGVDMAVSSDLISTQNPKGDDGLEVGMHQHTNFNTGVYFVRTSPGGKSLMAGWAAMRRTNLNENDQVGIYQFIRHRAAVHSGRVLVLRQMPGEEAAAAAFAADPDNYVRTKKEDPYPVSTEMRLGALGVHMLLNGYSYFIPKLHESMGISPLGVHMTWVPLSKEGKFHRFRDGMLYDDPPEYYDAPDLKFLTADIEAPDAPPGYNSWRETEDMIKVHLNNMPPQLRQMYRAVAVAAMLNRTLIFPRLRCYCFKNWFMSEQCRIPGDKVTQFPLDCALDQVFRPKVLYNYPPLLTKNGPQNFTFREYSLLDNPRTPAAVKDGQVLVLPEGAAAGNISGFAKVVRVKPGQMQDELVKALEEVKDAKVLRLRYPTDILAGFNDQVLQSSLSEFAAKVTANWCCRDEPYVAKGMAKKVKMDMAW